MIDEDPSVATITEERAAKGPDLCRGVHPTGCLQIELAEFLQRAVLRLSQEFDAHGGSELGCATLGLVLFPCVQGLAVDGGRYASVFGVGLDEFATSWDVLEEEGLVERRGADVALTERGGYFVPTIQATLAAERLGELKDARWEATRGSADAVAVAIRER